MMDINKLAYCVLLPHEAEKELLQWAIAKIESIDMLGLTSLYINIINTLTSDAMQRMRGLISTPYRYIPNISYRFETYIVELSFIVDGTRYDITYTSETFRMYILDETTGEHIGYVGGDWLSEFDIEKFVAVNKMILSQYIKSFL